ncbi:MAG TPA: DUF805 domain-containing protein [Burkholderiales bacterium]|jgi:uncharacterized membrane protein YhaH (DUF805 family)
MEVPANNPYQTPQAPVADALSADAGRKLTPKEIYFSFEGRLSRKPFWLYSLALIVPLWILFFILALISKTLMMIVAVPLDIVMIWVGLALQVKRWHDRDKSGWWVLIGLIPLIGTLWVFVEAGCLRGTEGGNRFGGDATDQY